MTVYTSGDWLVKAGQGDDFIKKWHEISEATIGELGPGGWQVLLCDTEDLRHFRSFGAWENEEAVVRLRDGCAFGERIGELNPMLEHCQTSVLHMEDSVGPFDAE